MLEGLAGCEPHAGIHCQNPLHKVFGQIGHTGPWLEREDKVVINSAQIFYFFYIRTMEGRESCHINFSIIVEKRRAINVLRFTRSLLAMESLNVLSDNTEGEL